MRSAWTHAASRYLHPPAAFGPPTKPSCVMLGRHRQRPTCPTQPSLAEPRLRPLSSGVAQRLQHIDPTPATDASSSADFEVCTIQRHRTKQPQARSQSDGFRPIESTAILMTASAPREGTYIPVHHPIRETFSAARAAFAFRLSTNSAAPSSRWHGRSSSRTRQSNPSPR